MALATTETTEMARTLWTFFVQEFPNSTRGVTPDFSGFNANYNPVVCNITIAVMANTRFEEGGEPLSHSIIVLIGAITYPIKNWLKRRERHGLDLDFVYEEIFMASGASRKAWTCKDTHALTQVDNVDNYFQNTWGTNTTVAFLDAATM